MKKHTGFTLIELMITVVIVGTLLSIGMVPLRTFMQGNQMIAASNELLSAMHVARSEAIKLNSRVSICTSDDGAKCTGSSDWRTGWIVFVDADGLLDNSGSACTAVGTDCLLRVHAGFKDKLLSVTGVDANAAAISSFTFTSRGMPKTTTGGSTSGTFSICSFDKSKAIVGSRAMILSLSGRVRISDNTKVITCPSA